MRKALSALVGVLAVVAAVAGPAQAGGVASDPSFDRGVSVTVTAYPSPKADGSPSTQAVITCTLKIGYPHKSTHVPGTINTLATWDCTAPVAGLDIDIWLFNASEDVVGSGSAQNVGRANLQANAYAGCVTGSYSGSAFGYVIFPAGYSPPTGFKDVYTPLIFVSCP